MRTSSLEILEKVSLPHAQAHAILKVMEVEMASAQEALATKADLLTLRGELLAKFAELEAKFALLRGELEGKLGAFEGKLGTLEGRLTRWTFTCILGQTAALAGLGYFFLAHFGR